MCESKEKRRLQAYKAITGSEVKKAQFNILDYLFKQMQKELFNQASVDGLDIEEYFFVIKLELVPRC